jgi:hypothetical protein
MRQSNAKFDAMPPQAVGGWQTHVAPLATLVVLFALSPQVGAEEGWQTVLDPNATISGENQLLTSIPSVFTGANVASLIGADRFYAAGITGQNTIAANVEAGQIWNGHETLGHVSNFVADPSTFKTTGNNGPEYDRHATWVGMMIGGRAGGNFAGDYQTGIAPGTDLRSGAISTGWSGSAFSLNFNANAQTLTTAYNAYFGSADVINSSWGGTDTTGQSIRATITDGLANQNTRTTFVASAGNSGPNPNTIGAPASAYNNIAVAALQNDGSNGYNSVASFSSRGPQDYSDPVHGTITGVRAEVDISAPGTNLTSAFYGGQTGGNSANLAGSFASGGSSGYSSGLAGTSFAAPIVAGAVALVDSASKNDAGLASNADSRDARVVKAVLLNSADKITGWNNGQSNVGGVITTTQSLDYASGAGSLNLNKAYDQYLTAGTRDVAGLGGGTVKPVGWDYGQATLGQTNSYLIDQFLQGGTNFTVTLDWFRDRTLNVGTLTSTDVAEANMDVIIRDVIAGIVVAQSISTYNNVEHLSFLLPSTSQYRIDVVYNSNLFGSITAEQYGLAWASTAAPAPGTLALMIAGAFGALVRRKAAKTCA